MKTLAAPEHVVLKRLTIILVLTFMLGGSRLTYSQARTIDLTALTQETQMMSRKADELTLLWWIPEEFWRASFAQTQDISPTQVEDFLKVLRPYFVLVAVDGSMGSIGGVTYKSEAAVREETQLIDFSGARYRALPEESVGPDVQNLLQMFKPVLGNMLGPLGQNMHFLLFPARTGKGSMIAEASKEGGFTIKMGANEYRWRLPLGSLIPRKTCPVDGEKLNGAWIYCPWHGVKLTGGSESAAKNQLEVKAGKKVVDLVKTWDESIWFFTSKENPIQSLDLKEGDVACWGVEHFSRVQAFLEAAGLGKDKGVRVIGTGNAIFSGMENPPRLFITSSKNASELKGAIRVVFVE